MTTLASAAIYAGASLLAGLFVVVFLQFLTGRISMRGLLAAKPHGEHARSTANRGQFLVTTIIGGLGYLAQVFEHPNRFPSIPWPVLTVIAASHAAYVLGKWPRRSS